jgi:hypothetical protein
MRTSIWVAVKVSGWQVYRKCLAERFCRESLHGEQGSTHCSFSVANKCPSWWQRKYLGSRDILISSVLQRACVEKVSREQHGSTKCSFYVCSEPLGEPVSECHMLAARLASPWFGCFLLELSLARLYRKHIHISLLSHKNSSLASRQ